MSRDPHMFGLALNRGVGTVWFWIFLVLAHMDGCSLHVSKISKWRWINTTCLVWTCLNYWVAVIHSHFVSWGPENVYRNWRPMIPVISVPKIPFQPPICLLVLWGGCATMCYLPRLILNSPNWDSVKSPCFFPCILWYLGYLYSGIPLFCGILMVGIPLFFVAQCHARRFAKRRTHPTWFRRSFRWWMMPLSPNGSAEDWRRWTTCLRTNLNNVPQHVKRGLGDHQIILTVSSQVWDIPGLSTRTDPRGT